MFRAGGISINYRVRGADAENPPDIIRVFKCDSCSSYGMHGSRYGDYKKSLIICSRKVEGRKGPLPKSKHCQCFDMVKITLRKDEYGYVDAM